MFLTVLLHMGFAYLCGSVPFGLLLTKFFLKQDITKIGSGNIGATNVLRTGNKKLAALTLLLDAVKPVPAILIAHHYAPAGLPDGFGITAYAMLAGLLAMIGHCYPVWLQFKGGKGVATTLGVLLAAAPFAGLAACASWLLSAKIGKVSSVAALSAMIVAPMVTYCCYGFYPALINIALSALVIYRHKENIKRIRAGTEPKIGAGKRERA